jgi:hypothetical protein
VHTAYNRDMLLHSLTERARRHAGSLGFPVIHIAAHGTPDGVELTDGHLVTWADLRGMLSDVTALFPDKLLLSMSSCHGLGALEIPMTNDSAPYLHAIVGSTEEVQWRDMLVAWVAFYHRLFKGAFLEESVSAMCEASGHYSFDVRYGTQLHRSYRRAYLLEVADWLKSRGPLVPERAAPGDVAGAGSMDNAPVPPDSALSRD